MKRIKVTQDDNRVTIETKHGTFNLNQTSEGLRFATTQRLSIQPQASNCVLIKEVD